MTYKQIITMIVLVVFYSVYLIKKNLQKKQGIQTNQIGKGAKARKTLLIERIMGSCSIVIIIAELISIMMVHQEESIVLSYIGIILMILGDISFIAAVVTMKESWRAGIAEGDKTELVTNGIYRISRNPAFLGFYLVYIGIMLAFANIGLVIITVATIITFHMQILQEEAFLKSRFGKEYEDYMKRVGRYFIFI